IDSFATGCLRIGQRRQRVVVAAMEAEAFLGIKWIRIQSPSAMTIPDRPGDLLPSPRILLGPGPSMADPPVLRALGTPLLGQFDPEFTGVMNEVMSLSRLVFQTANARTFPVSGTGRAGLEAAMTSLVEPGDRVVVAEFGRFGWLLIDLAERCGAKVVVVRAP